MGGLKYAIFRSCVYYSGEVSGVGNLTAGEITTSQCLTTLRKVPFGQKLHDVLSGRSFPVFVLPRCTRLVLGRFNENHVFLSKNQCALFILSEISCYRLW